LLAGCMNKAPSDQDVEAAIKALWAGYSWEFSSNFDVASFERLNGWKDGEDYWVEVAYKVKAKQPYYDMVADCVDPTAANYSDTAMGQLSAGLSAMMKGFQGTEALDDYSEYIKTHPEPAKMVEARQKYSKRSISSIIVRSRAFRHRIGVEQIPENRACEMERKGIRLTGNLIWSRSPAKGSAPRLTPNLRVLPSPACIIGADV